MQPLIGLRRFAAPIIRRCGVHPRKTTYVVDCDSMTGATAVRRRCTKKERGGKRERQR